MILLNQIQPVTQVVETPSPPSPIQCCIVLWALVFINLVETFFQHCLVGEGGRHNCTDSISTKGHWLYRTEKALITCHGIQVFDSKLLLENWQVYVDGKNVWCLRRLWSFPKWREEKPNLSFTPKTQKTGTCYRPTCIGEERTPKSPPYNCV